METNNETENKKGAGKKAIPVFYSTVPNILIQTKMLERIERQLAILFYSCLPLGGCNWSEEALKNYCECGPYHLKRAIKRLQHRRMLTVVDGGWKKNTGKPRRETNRYVFEKNPYKWKVTEEVQEKIVQQTYEMNMTPEPFEHPPFKNDIGFEKSFSYSHNKYADYGNTNSQFGWEIDHIYPASLGGSDSISNLQPLQWENNRHKGDSTSGNYCAVKAGV